MKELSIEEKAQAYDLAVKKIKNEGIIDHMTSSEIKDFLFPELAESKDEKIRKMIINLVKKHAVNHERCQMEAYLEKRKEQKSAWSEEDAKIRNEILLYIGGKDIDLDTHNRWCAWLEKLGEHKQMATTQEPKPKFKVGDWIVCCDYEPVQIIDITSEMYHWSNGDIRPIEMIDNNQNIHLWSIEDAKDGDVLAFYSEYRGNEMVQVGIIEKYVGKHGGCSNAFKIYVGVNWENNLQIGEYMGCSDIRPATQEQREFLFAKMKDADYEWDSEKKELKKIEQASDSEKTKDDNYGVDGMHAAIDILTKTLGKVDGYQTDDGILEHNAAIATVKKLREQKPAEWSEEDKEIMDNLLQHLKVAYSDCEWLEQTINWLKSLRPKNAWKPSRFQMAALYDIKRYAEEGDIKRTLLQSLYNDLKNLQK